MSELRALSTRAVITPNSFVNTYNFGDFRGDPRKLMESYFDAHVYVSNFGTVTFMLRLPSGVVPEETLTQYSTNDGLDWWVTPAHTMLEWQLYSEEPPEEWVEGEGWMAQLLPIRDELVRGDYRSLYIGWLSAIAGGSPEEEEEEDNGSGEANRREPPVPPGLGSLTGAQTALAQFLGVGIDLIAAAAEASPKLPKKGPSDQEVDAWIARLPEQEIRSIVARIVQGEGLRVQTELQSQYYCSQQVSAQVSQSGGGKGRRTAAELLAAAEETARARKRRESEEKQKKRRAHLAGLVPRFPELWATVSTLAQERKASSYDRVCSLLVDMRDASVQADLRPDFDAEFTQFLGRYSRSAALIRRLKEARLIS
jgi:hypothetical protein